MMNSSGPCPAVVLLLMLLAPVAAAAEAPPVAATSSPAPASGSAPSPAERAVIGAWFRCIGDGKPPLSQVTALLQAHPELAQAWSPTDPQQPWNTPQTALHLAVAAENKPLAELLIAHHASPDAQTRGCAPPLMWCNASMGTWLIAHGAHPTLFWFASIGDLAHAQAFLAQHPEAITARDGTGSTALACAASNGHKEVAAALIAAGADVNAVDDADRTVLDDAIGWDDEASRKPQRQELVDLLLAHGAHWDAFAAAVHGNLTELKQALDAHPALLTKHYGVATGDGVMLIHAACTGNHQDCVELLLARGQSIEAKDAADTTPLHSACVHGSSLVAWLLNHGADAGIHEKRYGGDPRGWAAYFRNKGALAAFDAVAKAAHAQEKAKAAAQAGNNF